MGAIIRIMAVLSGHKLIRLIASPRDGGYIFVNSPDLPGFSLMLRPNETESFDAILGPLKAFILAEFRACEATRHKELRITGMRRATPSEIVAELSAA